MLHVQEYLKTKTLDDLTTELGIVVKKHDTLPLAIINYDQIESPKVNPVVRECRGLVLHTQTHEIVAKSFNRFFNWGEVQEEMKDFDFSDFIVQSKEDGSLVLLYYFDGQWHANTRGSFALDPMQFQTFTWREGICKALGVTDLQQVDDELERDLTYVCEFCSPWNKIVRRYDKPQMFLLTAFRGEEELHWSEVDLLSHGWFKRPTMYNFISIEEVQNFLTLQSQQDATFEGVVLCDHKGRRWKVKSATYLGLHKMKGEGDNLFNPKHLLPFVMTGDEEELLTYFPEVRGQFFELKAEVQEHYIKLLETWADNKHIVDQKEFALAIQGKTPFTSVLFSAKKKYGDQQKAADVRTEWRAADSIILKKLKGI